MPSSSIGSGSAGHLRSACLGVLLVCGTAAPGQTRWKTLNFGTGYSVKVPANMQPLDGASADSGKADFIGDAENIHFVLIVGPSKVVNFKSVAKLATAQQALFDYITSQGKPTVTLQEALLKGGWPGMRFRFTKDGNRVEFRSFIVGTTSVLMSATYTPKVHPGAIVGSFFDSLTIDSGNKGPLSTPVFPWRKVLSHGVSYLLPGQPSAPETDNAGGVHYGAQKFSEFFAGMVRPITRGKSRDRDIRRALISENAALMHARVISSREDHLHGSAVTWASYSLSNGMSARSLAVVQGGNATLLLAVTPKALTQSPDLDFFFQSLQLAKER